MPSLYIVATPIGNMEDITLRAIRVLGEARLIAAEDTRTTRKLLSRYDIHTPLTSYHEHNRKQKLPPILDALKQGDVALVSEAGTPVVSDPGFELVQAAIEAGFPVVSIPGPSAVTTALVVSGLPVEQFLFLGFPPRRKGEREALLRSVAGLPYTLVFFEAPHRLRGFLADLLRDLGDRPLAAIREATKLHEEVFRGTISESIGHFDEPRGEFTLVVTGNSKEETPSPEDVEGALGALLKQGMSSREAVVRVANSTGVPRRDVYRILLRLKKETQGRV